MAHQEGADIKVFTIKMPWELFYQIKKDAKAHKEDNSTRARHILADALMDVKLTKEEYAQIDREIERQAARIREKISGC